MRRPCVRPKGAGFAPGGGREWGYSRDLRKIRPIYRVPYKGAPPLNLHHNDVLELCEFFRRSPALCSVDMVLNSTMFPVYGAIAHLPQRLECRSRALENFGGRNDQSVNIWPHSFKEASDSHPNTTLGEPPTRSHGSSPKRGVPRRLSLWPGLHLTDHARRTRVVSLPDSCWIRVHRLHFS